MSLHKYMITFVFLFSVVRAAEKDIPNFSEYDFSNLNPQPIEFVFPRVAINMWERCACDCPDLIFENVVSEETIDKFTYRNTTAVVKGPLTIKGTKKENIILMSNIIDDCTTDSIVFVTQDHPPPPMPNDPCCAEPTQKTQNVELPVSAGCHSTGSSMWLMLATFGFLLIWRRRCINT